MKKLILVLALLISGCAGSTQYGECVGLSGKKDSTLQYELSTRNIIVGTVFIETLVVPVIVALEYAYCPVSKK